MYYYMHSHLFCSYFFQDATATTMHLCVTSTLKYIRDQAHYLVVYVMTASTIPRVKTVRNVNPIITRIQEEIFGIQTYASVSCILLNSNSINIITVGYIFYFNL